ncbi:MAG: DUF87 domain-containing protein [Thermoplasmata archaeon]|nr:DUF87 domain-containing protein [Thermoplasmata archaeon]
MTPFRIVARLDPGLLRDPAGWKAPLLTPALPSELPFGFVGRALPLSEIAELRLELHRLPVEEALRTLERAGGFAEAEQASHPPAGRAAELELEVAGTREIAHRIAGREQELWRFGSAWAVRAPTPGAAKRRRGELAARLSRWRFRVRIPLYEADRALADPGGVAPEARPLGFWHTLPTDAVAAFFPFVDESVVEPGGVLVGLLLDDAAPVILNRWRHASHSWAIFGATGSGKTFAASLMAMRSRWMRPELELLIVDPLGEFGGFARALGGSVVRPAHRSTERINPLDPGPVDGDRDETAGRVGGLLRSLFPSLRDEEVAALDSALHQLYEAGGPTPILSDLAEVIGRTSNSGRLPGLLEVFRSGSLSQLNGPSTLQVGRTPIVFDLSGVPEEHMPFHLTYVLDFIYDRIRSSNRPTLVLVDEAHFLMRHPTSAAFMDTMVRHVRHYRAGLLLLSQTPEDFLHVPAGPSLLKNLRATLWLRQASVAPETRAFFDLTEAEVDWLPRARLPREAGYAEGLLRLGSAHLPLAVIASTPEYDFLCRALGAGSPAGRVEP